MQQGGDVKGVYERLFHRIKTVGDTVNAESSKKFMLDPKYGYLHSCQPNMGMGIEGLRLR